MNTRSGRLSSLPCFQIDATAEPLSESIGSFEPAVKSEFPQEVEAEMPVDHDEPVLSEHATTGSETESDVETTVRP